MLEPLWRLYPSLFTSILISVFERRPFTESAGFPTPSPRARALEQRDNFFRRRGLQPGGGRYPPDGPTIDESVAWFGELASRVPDENVDAATAASMMVQLVGPEVLGVLQSQFPADAITRATGGSMSFIGDLIGGIGDGIKSAVTALPGIATAVGTVTGAIQSIQGSLSGMPPLQTQTINPNTGSPMDAQAAFAMACNADPTGNCQAAIRAALTGGAGMTMPINPITGSPTITQAGLLGSALMNPTVINVLKSLGFGALVAGGEALAGGVAGLFGGGGGAPASGPLLMQWPAGTRYPRSLVLRAPDQPEKRFRSVGTPMLSSGDVAAVRRVQKAAARAKKGRRRSSARPQMVYALPAPQHHVCGTCLTSPCGCK